LCCEHLNANHRLGVRPQLLLQLLAPLQVGLHHKQVALNGPWAQGSRRSNHNGQHITAAGRRSGSENLSRHAATHRSLKAAD
jgi:hypothetical protein